MNRRWSGDKKKSVLTPTLSSEERETLFPRLVNLSALSWRWFWWAQWAKVGVGPETRSRSGGKIGWHGFGHEGELRGMTEPRSHPRDPLHGVTLETILNQLVQRHGWSEMGRRINIRCFQLTPTVKSSLTFLRKTPWARKKVEDWYIGEFLLK
jgi:hypothetical protein